MMDYDFKNNWIDDGIWFIKINKIIKINQKDKFYSWSQASHFDINSWKGYYSKKGYWA